MQAFMDGESFNKEALKQLNRSERILVGLYFYESLNTEEIALVMQKSTDVVENALENVFQKLTQNAQVETETTEFAAELF
ncbi:MAG: hypothetical protein AAFP70_00880 [Calditrichota bacterium]